MLDTPSRSASDGRIVTWSTTYFRSTSSCRDEVMTHCPSSRQVVESCVQDTWRDAAVDDLTLLDSGAALNPCAITLTRTVSEMTATTSSPASSRSSRGSRAKMTDARPRGPNQPMKPMAYRSKPAPRSASTTGSIRTSVRLKATYRTTLQLHQSLITGTARAPKMSQLTMEAIAPCCSTK